MVIEYDIRIHMKKRKFGELKFAFIKSIPVMLGYIFLGIAFGILLNDTGYNFIWAFIISLFVYAGSMEFLLISLISSGVSLIYAALMTLFVNGRHIFYGLTFVEKFKKMGRKYPYMIFSLSDETYSVLCDLEVNEELNENNIMFLIAFLNQLYWIIGSVLGGLIGEMITFNTKGIDFSMTALFVVIVVNQWIEQKNHKPAIIGGLVAIVCLKVFGSTNFLLISLTISSLILLGGRKRWHM